jgi:cell division protein FtsL
VNKLARREYDYIKGSTALAPQRKQKVRKLDEKYKKIQRRKKIQTRNFLLKNRRKNDRKYIVTVAVVMLGLGFTTIFGYSKVYNMQRKVAELNTEIKQTQEENEAIKVKLLKFSSLNNIEEKAKAKLSMSIPTKQETIKIDFSQDYFKDLEPSVSENANKKTNVLTKLINLIK